MQQLICYFSIIKNHSFPIALWIRASTSFLSIWLETLFCCCQFWLCSNPKLAAMQIIRMVLLCNIVSMLIIETGSDGCRLPVFIFETSLNIIKHWLLSWGSRRDNDGIGGMFMDKYLMAYNCEDIDFQCQKIRPNNLHLKFYNNRDWYLSLG